MRQGQIREDLRKSKSRAGFRRDDELIAGILAKTRLQRVGNNERSVIHGCDGLVAQRPDIGSGLHDRRRFVAVFPSGRSACECGGIGRNRAYPVNADTHYM